MSSTAPSPPGVPGARIALEARSVTKRFGDVVANDGVDLQVREGEVHALLGENGAGKSTLMHMLYGMHRPDAGGIAIDGEPVEIGSPRAAMALGVGMVHQHFVLVDVMTVAENIVLGDEPGRGPLLDLKEARRRVREVSDRFGLGVDPDARVEDLAVGEQQRVEIVRALMRSARILILDEPTAALTPQEVQELFRLLRGLAAEGKAIVLIAHKLDEVLAVADRITVLRRGRNAGSVTAAETTREQLAQLMVGREVSFTVAKEPARPGEPLLELRDLTVLDAQGAGAHGVSLTVAAGEIVAIAGVEGNGQSQLVAGITGMLPATGGTIVLAGRDVTGGEAHAKAVAGLGHIPADRRRHGLVLGFDLGENLYLRRYRERGRGPLHLFSPKAVRAWAEPVLQDYDVRGRVTALASQLSGGNQQKVVIARELEEEPRVIVASQPTRGLDIGAIEFVHRRLVEHRDAGGAVVLVSLDLDEVRGLADRVVVMRSGRLVAELDPGASDEAFGLAMAGGDGIQGSAAGGTA